MRQFILAATISLSACSGIPEQAESIVVDGMTCHYWEVYEVAHKVKCTDGTKGFNAPLKNGYRAYFHWYDGGKFAAIYAPDGSYVEYEPDELRKIVLKEYTGL